MGRLNALILKFRERKQSLARELQEARQREQSLRFELDELKQRNSEQEAFCQIRIKNAVGIDSPLVLISQIQRSGGTLLSQLFDGHPECHAHPHELYIGYPDKTTWPVLDLNDDPDMWFDILFEAPVERLYREGYQKYSRGIDTDPDIFPFIFLSRLQREIFNKCIDDLGEVKSARDIFDCYMTSYFNAWLDNQNLYATPKKIITAFVPRMNMREENVERFFDVYPDGRLISMIREPKDWYASARGHLEDVYGDIEEAIELWRASVVSTIRNKKQYGDRVFVLSYEDLVCDTETVMRSLAEYLNIRFSEVLLTPTFNGLPIKADSSYNVRSYGVITNSIGRYKTVLSNSEVEFIASRTVALYEEARHYVDYAHSPGLDGGNSFE